MKTKQLSNSKLRALYNTGTQKTKELLEETYGKDFFSQSVIDRIGGWKDMMEETGRPDVPEFVDLPEDLRLHFQKYYKVVIGTEAYNEGERMDIYNEKVWRHYPYFACNGSPAGFAFDVSLYGSTYADAGSGSRLALKSEERSNAFGRKHPDFFREWLES